MHSSSQIKQHILTVWFTINCKNTKRKYKSKKRIWYFGAKFNIQNSNMIENCCAQIWNKHNKGKAIAVAGRGGP
jgi:hypothetical protein